MRVPGVNTGAGEGGLLGLAVSPRYSRDRLVYAYFTTRVRQPDRALPARRAGADGADRARARPGSTTAAGSRSGPTASSTRASATPGTRRSAQDRELAERQDPAHEPGRQRAVGAGLARVVAGASQRAGAGLGPARAAVGERVRPERARRGQPDPARAQLRVARGRGRRSDRRSLHEPAGDVVDVGGVAERRRDHRLEPVRRGAAGRVRVADPAARRLAGHAASDARPGATGGSGPWWRRPTGRCGWRRPTATGAARRAPATIGSWRSGWRAGRVARWSTRPPPRSPRPPVAAPAVAVPVGERRASCSRCRGRSATRRCAARSRPGCSRATTRRRRRRRRRAITGRLGVADEGDDAARVGRRRSRRRRRPPDAGREVLAGGRHGVAPAAGTKIDESTGKVTLDAKQPGGTMKVKARTRPACANAAVPGDREAEGDRLDGAVGDRHLRGALHAHVHRRPARRRPGSTRREHQREVRLADGQDAVRRRLHADGQQGRLEGLVPRQLGDDEPAGQGLDQQAGSTPRRSSRTRRTRRPPRRCRRAST